MLSRLSFSLKSDNDIQTQEIAQSIGRKLRGNETVELVGDIGAGKTTFVRGLARGMNSDDVVASPSFTISKIYRSGSLEIHHYDYYRLSEPGILADELIETLSQSQKIVVIEWSDIVKDLLPDNRLTVSFLATTNNGRVLKFEYPEQMGYTVSEIKK